MPQVLGCHRQRPLSEVRTLPQASPRNSIDTFGRRLGQCRPLRTVPSPAVIFVVGAPAPSSPGGVER